MQGGQSPESSAAEILRISSAGMCKRTPKSGARSPSLKTSVAGGKAQPVGPGRPRKAPGWERRQNGGAQGSRLRLGAAPAPGAPRVVRPREGAGPGCGRGLAASGGGGLHEARPLPYAGGLPARCTSASRASASSLAPSRPPRSSGRAGFPPHPQSLMNIERPLLYFPSSIAEAEARHIVRRRRRLILESRSGRGQRSPGLGQKPVSGADGTARGARAGGGGRQGDAGLAEARAAAGLGVCVCVRGPRGAVRRWRRRPRSLARSAARGPPGRAHCSRPVSTGLARRREPFPWSASAPPSAYGCRGPHGRLRSNTRTSPRASPRDREVLAVGAGWGAWGRRPSCLRYPGSGWAGDPLLAPHSWRAAPCSGVSVAASESRGLTPEVALGEGGGSVCSGSFAF